MRQGFKVQTFIFPNEMKYCDLGDDYLPDGQKFTTSASRLDRNVRQSGHAGGIRRGNMN